MFFEKVFVVDEPEGNGLRSESLHVFDQALTCRLGEIPDIHVRLKDYVPGFLHC